MELQELAVDVLLEGVAHEPLQVALQDVMHVYTMSCTLQGTR